jgi:hypothetical protein
MSANFMTKTTPAMEKIVNDSLSQSSDIGAAFEQMKSALRDSMGLPSPHAVPEDPDNRVIVPATAAPSSPIVEPTCVRVIYPHSNSRFELVGISEEDLDRQEQKIRALYQ